jgi:hypothetical protein
VKAKDAWDEEVDVMKYVLYTDAELTQRLNRYKEMRINESKNNLSTFLSLHPIQWTDGKYYSVTSEKQALLTSNLALYQISTAAGQSFKLT